MSFGRRLRSRKTGNPLGPGMEEAASVVATEQIQPSRTAFAHLILPEGVYVLQPLRRRVRWTADTVDNEDLGRKKSNMCCIFHTRGGEQCPPDDGWNAYEPRG